MFPDTRTSIRDLSARLAREQLRSADRYSELLRAIARRRLDPAAAGQEVLRFARESAGDYARNLLALSFGYRVAVLDLSRQYGDRLLERLLRASGSAGLTAEAHHRAEIVLSGPLGGEAAAPFVIQNEQSQPVDISFIVSEFTDTAGQAPFRPPLRLEPPTLTIGPGAEGLVTLHLPLLRELFLPGRLYRATVLVRGHDLKLVLHALAYEPPVPAGPGAPPVELAPPVEPDQTPERPARQARRTTRPARPPRVAKPKDGGRPRNHGG